MDEYVKFIKRMGVVGIANILISLSGLIFIPIITKSFSTADYHVFRSGVIANECGIDCEGMGSKTKWYFYTNALIREFIASLVQERKKHISLIVLMNISAIILISLGYFNQLIKF